MSGIPRLRISLAEAEANLTAQIRRGRRLDGSGDWLSTEGLAEIEQKLLAWEKDTYKMLEHMFDTAEFAEAFRTSARLYDDLQGNDRQRVGMLGGRIEYKAQNLEQLLKQLPDYQDPNRAESRQPETVPVGVDQTAAPVDFDKVTLHWLFTHLPVKIWATIVGLLIGAVLLGIGLGQTTLVRELIGKPPNSATVAPPKLTSEELKTKVDQLIQGHNERRQKLTEAIIEQQRGIGLGTGTSYERRQAIADLEKDIEKEDAMFQSDLKALNPSQK